MNDHDSPWPSDLPAHSSSSHLKSWKLEQRVQERYSFSRLEELLAKKEGQARFSAAT
jgi:hypothetical protein